jgi:hypothetical protein
MPDQGGVKEGEQMNYLLYVQFAIAAAFAASVGRLFRRWLENRLHRYDVRRQVRRNYRRMMQQ